MFGPALCPGRDKAVFLSVVSVERSAPGNPMLRETLTSASERARAQTFAAVRAGHTTSRRGLRESPTLVKAKATMPQIFFFSPLASRRTCRYVPPALETRQPAPRRGGRVVECTALEMRHGCKPIGGSNPPLSAMPELPPPDAAFQCPRGPHPLRLHMEGLGHAARSLHPRPGPANAGTKHLICEAVPSSSFLQSLEKQVSQVIRVPRHSTFSRST